jgi:regulator of protease activity HflC (stomatin/prohibitin superfamily)
MFDRLVDVLVQCADLFRFWTVLYPYEKGVMTRFGKTRVDSEKRAIVLNPGFHWKLPFNLDKAITDYVVPSTHSMGNESVTTKDGKSIGYHAIVTYQVNDIEKALLEVHDVDHAVRDACSGEIARVLMSHTWAEIIDDQIYEDLTKACRKRGWKWGIEIMAVQLAGLALVKNLRLMSNT